MKENGNIIFQFFVMEYEKNEGKKVYAYKYVQ